MNVSIIFIFRLTWGFECSEPSIATLKGAAGISVQQPAIVLNHRSPGSSIPELKAIKISGHEENFSTKVLGAPCILKLAKRSVLSKEGSHAIVAALYLLIFLVEKYIASTLRIENEEVSTPLL